MAAPDAILFGRRTWQTMARPGRSARGDPFSERINTFTKYVASRTLTEEDLTWTSSGSCRPTTRSAPSASCAT